MKSAPPVVYGYILVEDIYLCPDDQRMTLQCCSYYPAQLLVPSFVAGDGRVFGPLIKISLSYARMVRVFQLLPEETNPRAGKELSLIHI